jgi:hypothetical protein
MSSVVISGDTSGAITLSAPAVAGTNTLTLPASTGTVLLGSSTQLCKAWVNYKGTATRGINASYNVSSVTFNGTGDYTVNFTNAMTDANYATMVSQIRSANGTTYTIPDISPTTAPTTSAVRVENIGSGGTTTSGDSSIYCVVIFGN